MATTVPSMPATSIDLRPLRAAGTSLEGLKADGWDIRETDFVLQVSAVGSSLRPILDAIRPLTKGIIGGSANGTFLESSMTLSPTASGAWELTRRPSQSYNEVFPDPVEIDTARAAWDGELNAILALPFSWTVRATVDLARVLELPSWVEARVSLSGANIDDRIAGLDINTVRQIVPKTGRRIYIALDVDEKVKNFGAVSLLGLHETVELPPRAEALPGEIAHVPNPSAVLPHTVISLESSTAWSESTKRLQSLASLLVWSEIGTPIESNRLEFMGFKRTQFEFPSTSLFGEDLTAKTMELRQWLFAEDSPDRLLATKQVCSLYESPGPFDQPADVLKSAELIYVGLRSVAVAEVVRSSRDAQSQAQAAVDQSLRSSQEVLRSASDRLVGGLAAVGAVVVGNITAVIPFAVTTGLMLLVAGFFLILCVFAIAIDGPMLSSSTKYLRDSVDIAATLLTSEQRDSIVGAPSVVAAQRRVRSVRIAVPLLYGVVAASVVVYALTRR